MGARSPSVETARLRAARPEDLEQVLALLAEAGLPAEGVSEWLDRFVVVEDREGRVVGAVGLEVHGTYGLLRSVVVAREHRGRGLASAMVEEIIARASRSGLSALYLLTETAEPFFSRHGFARVERERAAAAIGRSREFRELCAASAAVMSRRISAEG